MSNVLDEIEADSDNDDVTEEEKESAEEQARKKARMSKLHEHYVAPLSFIADAVESGASKFNITNVNMPFGNNHEAYARPCYEDITQKIRMLRKEFRSERKAATLFVVGGSSGIGKSTFLAYFVVRMRNVFNNIALCYAPKSTKGYFGNPSQDEIECVVWYRGVQQFKGTYGAVKEKLKAEQGKLNLILMDGCSMTFVDVEAFEGTILISASPSLYVKNLKDAIFNHRTLIMPAYSETEAISTANILGVDADIVKENFFYMKGIARYFFRPGAAKQKVKSAVLEVSAAGIIKMVSMQASNRGEQLVAVHSLILWKEGASYTDPPSFELVSRYAEQLVAKKLAAETMEDLKNARRNMAPLSGAEGYAGALFEAYAIRTLQAGGTFEMRSLEDASKSDTLDIPVLTTDRIVIEGNKLSAAEVPYNSVRVPDETRANCYHPRLLWPTTTNFPTFDCIYFGTDGRVFPFQITIARTHDLKNSGAANAKQYLDGLLEGSSKPAKYPAVVVVPIDIFSIYTKQAFTGAVNKKPADYGCFYEQWVIGV